MIYTVFMILGMASAWSVSRFTRQKLPLAPSQRWFIGLVGFGCGVLLAKMPFWLLSDELLEHAGPMVFSGKTILLGLVGGYLGVELAKWYLGITTKTGDSFAVPVAVGIGVGRLGCFFGGCCYGTPTDLSWGVVFSQVDALARHPTQLYESVFHLTAAAVLFWALQRGLWKGQLIKLYFLGYFLFRFLTEFIRPEHPWAYGLSGYQWAILLLAPVFGWLLWRDARESFNRDPSLGHSAPRT